MQNASEKKKRTRARLNIGCARTPKYLYAHPVLPCRTAHREFPYLMQEQLLSQDAGDLASVQRHRYKKNNNHTRENVPSELYFFNIFVYTPLIIISNKEGSLFWISVFVFLRRGAVRSFETARGRRMAEKCPLMGGRRPPAHAPPPPDAGAPPIPGAPAQVLRMGPEHPPVNDGGLRCRFDTLIT